MDKLIKTKPLIGVSGCLIGEEVRHDGQHKRNPHVLFELNELFEYKSFCPEVAMGLGIPRKTIRLVLKNKRIHLTDTKDHDIDHTSNAKETFPKLAKGLTSMSGFILTKGSPTCGHDPIKVYDNNSGHPIEKSRGLWAQYLEDNFPLVPKIDSGRLYDEHLRDTFRTQVILFQKFNDIKRYPKELINFHKNCKYYLLQYGTVHLKKLGNICAGISKSNFSEKYNLYREYLFGIIFKEKITNKKRVDVLQHVAGYFKNNLSKSDKAYLHDNIKAFHKGKVTFQTIITLIEFLVKTYDQEYLKDQYLFKLYSKI